MNNNSKDNQPASNPRDLNSNRLEQRSSAPNDLPDSERDRDQLQPEETFIDLPDVKDIPGQEFVNAPPLGALGDTTISSDDEEGVSVFERDDSEDLGEGNDADVSRDEKISLLQADYLPTQDEDNLHKAAMDNVDFDNEPLNERSFGEETSGKDLDVPGSDDARNRSDEENKFYSLGSSDNDNVTEGTP